jgi:hypothetical protein
MQMKKRLMLTLLISFLTVPLTVAQTEQVAAPTGQKTLAATMNVYVFPTQGQDAEQQSKHEAECYAWAVQNTGNDPFDLAKKAEQQKQQAEREKEQAKNVGAGAGARGAVRGAAAGALIGEIVDDDAGEGAAYGAAAGAIRGRRRARAAQRDAKEQAERREQKAQQATQEQIENFKKAFSVCLEAKDYLVKY